MRRSIPLLAAVLLISCGKKDEDPPPSGERTKEPVPETPKDAPKGPFAGFDFAAAQTKWEGSWTLRGGLNQTVAWMIDGTKLVEFDGKTEKTYEFGIYSPCQITFTDVDAGSTTYKTFTFVGDTLYAGLGSAGTSFADATVACMAGKTYVLRGDVCEEWSEMFNDWKSEPATCTITTEGTTENSSESPTEVRKFVVGDRDLPFLPDGQGQLANQQMQGNVATKHANFAAAKAALPDAG